MKWEPQAPINEAAGRDGGDMGREKKTVAGASRPKLTSKVAQLRARVSSRRRVYKDGARAAVVIKTINRNNGRSAGLTAMQKRNVTRQATVFVVEPQRQRRKSPPPHDLSLCHCVRPTATELR